MPSKRTPIRHLPYEEGLVSRARELRKNMTPAEKKLWYQYLCRFPLRVWRQRPIDRYVVDFYCPKLKLVIEVDGDSHFQENAPEQDAMRTATLESYGLRVVRFTNADVLENLEGVAEILESYLEEANPECRGC